MVRDLEPDNRRTDKERAAEETPGAAKHDIEFGVPAVETPVDGGASGLTVQFMSASSLYAMWSWLTYRPL